MVSFMRNSLPVVVVLVVLCGMTRAVDYCNDKVTRCSGYEHIACGNNGNYQKACQSQVSVIPMTPALRGLFVRTHNELRNEFAKGIDGFKPAARLGTVIWDDGLAKMAELNVKRCDVRADKCRNTPYYKYVGQNVGASDWQPTQQQHSVEEVVEHHLKSWFSQKRFATMSDLEKYPIKAPKDTFAHFALMVNQRAQRIGCATLRETYPNNHIRQITTCNYSYDNFVNGSTYTTGQIAFQCTTGKDTYYTNLCTSKEVYNYNP